MKKLVRALVLVVGLLMLSTPLLTHHSNAVVDKDKLVTATGTVSKFAFVNPHVAVYWNGQDATGNVVEWFAAGAGPRALAEVGWNNKTFQVGEKILVQGHPLRDGRPVMAFRALYRCNGEGITLDPGNATEYRTRVKIIPLNPDRVKALCSAGKFVEGPITSE
jgi:hypothetical protein